MTTIANSIDKLIDALAGENVIMDSPTIANRIEQLADAIEDGDITIGGGAILRCNLTYTATGIETNPYIGHLDHAAEILDALDPESSYDPIIVINYALPDSETYQLNPAMVIHTTGEYQGSAFTQNTLKLYGNTGVQISFTITVAVLGSDVENVIEDQISGITAEEWTVTDDVITFANPTESNPPAE